MSKKHYLIYQITNTVNNKIYIGKHITENVDDDYFGSGKYLRYAQEKYGLDKFIKTILFELQNKEEMNLLEQCVVTKEFCDRTDTYNINVGGDGGWSYVNETYDHDKRVRNGKRWIQQLNEHPEHTYAYKLKHMSDDERLEHSLKLSNSIKRVWKINGHNWLGKHHSEASKEKMKATNAKYHPHSGKNNHMTGKHWYKDPNSKQYGAFKDGEQPNGWIRGKYLTENERTLAGLSGKGKVWIRSIDTNEAMRVDKDTAAKLISNGTHVKGGRIMPAEAKEHMRLKCLETRLANGTLKEIPNTFDTCIFCGKQKDKNSYKFCSEECHKQHIENELQNRRNKKTKELIDHIDSQKAFDCQHNKWYDGVVNRKQVRIYLDFYGHNHCECCGKKDVKFTVHAKDGNCKNLSIDNYELLCRECYLKSGTAGFTGHSMKEINAKR